MKKIYFVLTLLAISVCSFAQQQPASQERVRELEVTIARQDSVIRQLQAQLLRVQQQSIQTTYGKRMVIDRRSKQPVYR